MISIVIPLGHGSRWQDNELRYCLRGIEENLEFKDIWIIGRIPTWVKNVNFIPFSDSENVSDHNIMKKVKVACEHPITDRFLFANDDHFLLHKFDINNFPNYYDGTCHDLLKNRHQSPYQRRVRNTMNYLIANKLPQYYFDIHYPIIYEKDKFVERVVSLPWNKTSFVIKSLYANHEKEKEYARDCKSEFIPWKEDKCFSTMPKVSDKIRKFLEFRFPKKSNFEI